MRREFVSFPKSGRSWLRYALRQVNLAGKIAFHHDGFEFNDGSKPALDFDSIPRIGRIAAGNRIVYMSRDPRDVMVSLYHQITGRFRDFFDYQGDISDFIRDDYFGAQNLKGFQSMWSGICARHDVLHVTYEACHEDFPGVLRRIVDFYGFEVSAEAIAEAAENSSYEKMKAVERSGEFPLPWLRPRNGAFKVRNARVGGYKDVLSQVDIDYLNQVFFENIENKT